MDATFGTNNAGMDLFAILAELDGTGIPLAYCFVQTISVEDTRHSGPGALTAILDQFLRVLKSEGLDPAFFGVDKDFSEIAAVKQVFPSAEVQLCFWHAKRAIQQKMRDASKTKTQAKYFPAEAQAIVPSLEICWGSMPTRRPQGDHFFGRCQCPSRSQRFDETGRMETATPQERESGLNMVCRHFNAHSSIPDQNGTFRTPETIHSESASELYSWCKARGCFRLWSYMIVNWYRPGQWELWARSANPAEIPVLKTTMIVESYWRKIRHDFLHRFNRPRIDLVLWVLVSRVIPSTSGRLKAIMARDYREATSSWRKDFKKQWKELTNWVPEGVAFENTIPIPKNGVVAVSFFSEAPFSYASTSSIALSQLLDRWSFFKIFEGKGVAHTGSTEVASWFFVLSLHLLLNKLGRTHRKWSPILKRVLSGMMTWLLLMTQKTASPNWILISFSPLTRGC